jgi:hypothetical protein
MRLNTTKVLTQRLKAKRNLTVRFPAVFLLLALIVALREGDLPQCDQSVTALTRERDT